MPEIAKTMKLHILPSEEDILLLKDMTKRYAMACDYISQYVFDNGFQTNSIKLQEVLYSDIRDRFGLKSQMTISSFKTVSARYGTVSTQFAKKPYRYEDENGKWQSIPRTLEWLMKPIAFRRPQADLVRGRDYSFVTDKKTGTRLLSINTLEDRVRVRYNIPKCFRDYFDGTWKFGTGKVVSLKGEWYFHIPMTRVVEAVFDGTHPKHVVGVDRGLRFLSNTYSETGDALFLSGKGAMKKRDRFQVVRDELQSRGTKSAKRVLKRISGRENRWMADVNHRLSKTLVERYGAGTLFVLEDLTGVSFNEEHLANRPNRDRRQLRSWSFYQLEQFLAYKAEEAGSRVTKVAADYTSQRCPKCGRIHKENRSHSAHLYTCDCCGYRSNDDRIGAMNLQFLGTMQISGFENPRFRLPARKLGNGGRAKHKDVQ